MTMTDNTSELTASLRTDVDLHEVDGALLAITAQQAVLPRRLDDGQLYAVLDADGAVQIVKTPGYAEGQKRADLPRPRSVERDVTVTDVASLLDYIDENTADGVHHAHLVEGEGSGALEVWADIDYSTITAILDGYDGWRQHTATLQLSKSREWREWLAIDGQMMGQGEFAEFIEDHLSTIGEPDGAKLLDICQTLTGHTNVRWENQQILANGQRSIRWQETVEAKAGIKGDLTIPEQLKLVVRPYRGGQPVLLTARFRLRIREGNLALGVKIAEPDKVLEDAFSLTCDEVQAGLPDGVTIRHGVA